MITIDAMKDQLLTVDDVMDKLSKFEPFGSIPIEKTSSVSFRVDPTWAVGLDTLTDTDPVEAYITVDGAERQMTKESFNQLAVSVGLPAATVKKVPADAVEGFLNRMYRSPDSEVKLITVGDVAAAVSPATIEPFSNVALAESALDSIRRKYGSDAEIFADYKFQNTLTRTDVRFIVPAEYRVIRDSYMDDVPVGSVDEWAAGVHLSNSLTGRSQTFVDSYLFRWWCTNGATETLSSVGGWDRRRSSSDSDDVYTWAANAVNEVLGGMEERFDRIQSMTELEVRDASAAVGDLFSQFNLPARQRNRILDTLSRTSHLTMYSLMQAVTEAANEEGMKAKDVERLLRIGGVMTSDVVLDPQKARIWDAGHHAPSGAVNPYAIGRA